MFDYQKSRDIIAKKRENLAKNSPKPDFIERKPAWLKVPLPSGENYGEIKENLRSKGLFTVCEEAKCPNISECWAAKTATVMILGGTCTRACKFCHVDTGNPKGIVNKDEIDKTAEMVGIMKLDYIVITSVDRDDLPDFGSSHFSAVVKKIHELHPQTMVETLIPDFDADDAHMHTLAKSNPLVIAQNMETVKRLTHVVRDKRAGYEKTLKALGFYKKNYPNIYTKTSLMVGLGESLEEITECLLDLRKIDVDIVTFGQYLRPTTRHLKVERYYSPEEFESLKTTALNMGFKFVASGPLVRSSYKASDFLKFLRKKMELTPVRENIYFIEKWNADYSEVLNLQEKCVELVRQNPKWSIFIFCNHPNCFTLGRGLQRAQEFKLIDFDPTLKERLPFPLYEIKRGGGLTFHHPGQWVLYPIINLNRKNIDVYKVMNTCLSITQKILEEKFQITDLSHEEKLLGLWHLKKRKVASIGLAVSHFVTYHGISLNILRNEEMAKALMMVNPCGLPGEIYQDVESISPLKLENPIKVFHNAFREHLLINNI